jgi:hypothetical protein
MISKQDLIGTKWKVQFFGAVQEEVISPYGADSNQMKFVNIRHLGFKVKLGGRPVIKISLFHWTHQKNRYPLLPEDR